jgi:hypothetical protein
MHVNAIQASLLLLIEVADYVLVFAALFAVPVALALGIRRILKNWPITDQVPPIPNRAPRNSYQLMGKRSRCGTSNFWGVSDFGQYQYVSSANSGRRTACHSTA